MKELADMDVPYRDNPYRPPDWRWKVASEYRQAPGRRNVRRSVDAVVLRAAAVQEDMSRFGPGSTRSAYLTAYGPVGSAVRLYSAGVAAADPTATNRAPAMLTAELEGYVLAGLDDRGVADRLGGLVPPPVVKAYHDLFFDVRDRLEASAWVAASVIGSLQEGTPDVLLRALVRAYGYYFKSADVVGSMARAIDVAATRRPPRELYDAVLEDAKLALAVKASLTARAVRPGERTFRSVLEMQLRQVEINNQAGDVSGDKRQIQEAMTHLLTARAKWAYRSAPAEGDLPELPAHEEAQTCASDP